MAEIDYNIFLQFFDKYKAKGFMNVDPADPLVVMMEEKLESTSQFLHVADLINLDIIYYSGGCHKFFGTERDQIGPGVYYRNTHPDDLQRHSVGRAKLIKMGMDMFNVKSGRNYMSTNLKTKDHTGTYVELLYQLCVCYSDILYPSVYSMQINTDVSGLLPFHHGFHYYAGDDGSMFRYPDRELLMTGSTFTKREFDIIRCISEGLNSKQIAEKLFLSKHTVNTHRRNILAKTNSSSTFELIFNLKERGVL